MPNNRSNRSASNPKPLPRPGQQASPAQGNPNRAQRQGQGGGGNAPRQGGGHGGGGNNPHAGGGGGGNNPKPSPWLGHPSDPDPKPDDTASFIEYLRWMRVPDGPFRDGTKVDLVHRAEAKVKVNIGSRLQKMNARTKLIAGEGNTFQVACPWRIRVGGAKGPESMLLPAFDHLGIPYIPSSTLRGVARAQGIRALISEGHSRAQAEKEIAQYLGSLDADDRDKAGKVIFLDAYPMPTNTQGADNSRSGGLTVDISNNIWSWDGNNLKYSPNPNVFFSLKQATFLIGIRKGPGCTDNILAQVKKWLLAGLENGVGSQINSGYGRLVFGNGSQNPSEFLRLPFELQGQLIHGRQKFTRWNLNNHGEWQHHGAPDAEVRPVAFKNMLRYWFRAFGLGVLPARSVQEWEGKLFGAITPNPQQGWIRVEVLDGKLVSPEARTNQQGRNDSVGKQSGTLVISYSGECPVDKKDQVKTLFLNLTWLMFHLGGVGQGARRPCYPRRSNPRYRGSSLYPSRTSDFWKLPASVNEFKALCQRRICDYFYSLAALGIEVKLSNLNSVQDPKNFWAEAVDSNCKIIVANGEDEDDKSYALYYLHSYFHQLEEQHRVTDAKNLCGGVRRDTITINDDKVERKVVPSPVWIAQHRGYQVITVFGANQQPRSTFLTTLCNDANNYAQIWPISNA